MKKAILPGACLIIILPVMLSGCTVGEIPAGADTPTETTDATPPPVTESPGNTGTYTPVTPVTPVPSSSPTQPVISEITAKSGSALDIQIAANLVYAAGGGTVHIPEGDFQLNGSVRIGKKVKLIGAGRDKTMLRTTGQSMVIHANGDDIRISGFSLISSDNNGGNGIEIENSVDFRVDNLYIEGYSNQAAVFVSGIETRGVIDHNEIKVSHTSDLGYGVVIYRDEFWEEDMRLGTENAVFIEDNVFVNPRHAVAANSGAHYVFRYNLIKQGTQAQAIDAHGPYWSSNEGTRAVEIYNNLVEDPEGDGSERAVGIRGGGGVIFNNTIKGYTYGVMLMMENKQELDSYPVYHQVNDLYIWNNSYDGVSEVIVQNERKAQKFIQENRDFFRYPKPGYVPYTYPHPLTLEVESNKGEPESPALSPIGDRLLAAGQLLTFTVSASNPYSGPLNFSAFNMPAGASFDSLSGTFSWIPRPDQVGTYTGIRFEVNNGVSAVYENITIAVSSPSTLPLRVNCGGGQYIDSQGNSWKADQRYTTGSWGFYGEDFTTDRGEREISATVDDGIYRTERWGFSGYLFDLPDGAYTVVLHLAETYASGTARRVFSVSIQGNQVLTNLDVFSEAGMDTALVKTIPNVIVNKGSLNIAITGNISLSEINGIEILPEGLSS